MATLIYKMTHTGDPDFENGWWGVDDCMGPVRGFPFDAVVGIGGRSWWRTEPSRAGEIVWVGVDAKKVPEPGKDGPMVTFDHFRPFSVGELFLSDIAPELNKSMQNRRFRLYDFSAEEKKEIKRILAQARKARSSKPLAHPFEQADGPECGLKARQRAGCT